MYVFEALRISNMTKRPKGKQNANGQFLPNGAKAKAGLNRAILSSAWGQVVALTIYKALRHDKLVITVPPRIVHRNVRCAPSLPRTIGQPKPSFPQDSRYSSSAHAVDTPITQTAMPPW